MRVNEGDQLLVRAERYLNENVTMKEFSPEVGLFHISMANTLIQAAQAHFLAANVRGGRVMRGE
jgi:hypothetical protein